MESVSVQLTQLGERLEALTAGIYVLAGLVFLGLVLLAVTLVQVSKRRERGEASEESQDFSTDRANELFERDQIDELIRYTEGVLSHAPNNLQARYFLGLAYYRNRDYRSALREFNAVIALNPAWRDDPIGPFLHEIEEHGLAAEPPARKH